MELYSLQSINERRQEFLHINYSSDAVKWGINNSRYCLGEKIRRGDHISHDKKIKGAMSTSNESIGMNTGRSAAVTS